MKIILFFSLYCSFSIPLYAQTEQVLIKDFDFNYQNPNGQGTAGEFSYSKKLQGTQDIQVEKKDNDFFVSLIGVENKEFTFKNVPEFIQKTETMTISDLELNLSQNSFFKLGQGRFTNIEDDMEIKSLQLACNRTHSYSELQDQMITGCIEQMQMTATEFKSLNIANLIAAFTAPDSGSTLIRNIDVNVQNGILNFSAYVKAQISGTARGKGSVSYDQQNELMAIKITQVKFGILDVTGRIFDELAKVENSQVTINRPFIYLKLK